MNIKVIYTGLLYRITQQVEEEIEVENSITVYDLVQILLQKYGEPFRDVLIDKSTKKFKISIYINGKFNTGNIQLKNNDRVGFMFIVTGG